MKTTSIGNLPESLHYSDIDYDVAATLEHIGCKQGYGMVFTDVKDGDYIEVWGAFGTVPYLNKTAYQLVAPEDTITEGCKCCNP